MPDLGETNDPKALVPGDMESTRQTAWSMTVYGDLLHKAGAGLQRIDTTEGWSGEAADAFRSAYDGEPKKWLQAGDCFHSASKALNDYISSLTWAQFQATEAVRLWEEGEAATQQATREREAAARQAPSGTAPVPFSDPGETNRRAARDILHRARTQLTAAGDVAAEAVGRARDQAPEQPGWLEHAASAVGNAGAHLVNGAASIGNAALQNPESVVAMAAGVGLTAVSATGEVAGLALDATGAGAAAGAPLGAISTAGITAGVGMAGAGMANIAYHAAGDDTVEPLDTDDNADLPREQTEDASSWDHVEGESPNPADIHVDDAKRAHVLDGDGMGRGGHAPGTGVPGKTEFPEAWDDDKIISSIEDVAKRPDTPPKLDDSGSWKVQGSSDGVNIEGYVDKNGRVLTGYPTGGPGVITNP